MPLVGGHIVLDDSATHGFHCLPAKIGELEDMMVDDSRKDGYKNDNSHLLCSLRVYFEGRVLHVASAADSSICPTPNKDQASHFLAGASTLSAHRT